MEIQPDFRDLLALLTSHDVDFVVVGGYALAFHGAPRFTGDLDVLVRADAENAQRAMAALEEFGFGSLGLHQSDFEAPGRIIQLGVPPVRIDIITSLSGVSWEQVAEGKEAGKYGDLEVYYIGRSEFIVNKRAAGRRRDLADIEALGEE